MLWWACHKGTNCVYGLIRTGADVDVVDTHFERTPLMGCLEYSGWEFPVVELLAKNANLSAENACGETALDILWLKLDEDLGEKSAGSRRVLLLLANAGIFEGAPPPAQFLPHLGLAISEHAETAKEARAKAEADESE